MAHDHGIIVIATDHAVYRARARGGLQERDIIAQVRSAIADGRKAVHQPGWAHNPEYGRRRRADRTKAKGAARGNIRWVWDEPETIAYLIRLYGDRIVVISAIGRIVDAEAA